MTKVIDIINKKTAPFVSFELVPPLKGSDINKLYHAIEPLMEFEPPFINITFHRDEVEFRQKPDGSFEKVILTKRPGSVAIAAAIMKRFPVEVVPHLICGGATKYKLENDLIDLNFLDIQNIMALRGDPIPGQKYFVPEPDGHRYSWELVRQIHNPSNPQHEPRHLPGHQPDERRALQLLHRGSRLSRKALRSPQP